MLFLKKKKKKKKSQTHLTVSMSVESGLKRHQLITGPSANNPRIQYSSFINKKISVL